MTTEPTMTLSRIEQMIARKAMEKYRCEVTEAFERLEPLLFNVRDNGALRKQLKAIKAEIIEQSEENVIGVALQIFVANVAMRVQEA